MSHPDEAENLDQPSGNRHATARLRSALYQDIREFFWQRHFTEVETPLISSAASTEPHLASMEAAPWPQHSADTQQILSEASQRHGRCGYLITSPEYPMKRLMAEWQCPIFQITKCFRALEQSARHNPEFSMLEWYRPHATLDEIEVDLLALLEVLSGREVGLERISYAQAFERETGLNPFTLSIDQAKSYALETQLSFPDDLDRLGWVDLIFSLRVEPSLGAFAADSKLESASPNSRAGSTEVVDELSRATVKAALNSPLKATLIHDFLPEQASLAQTQTDGSGRTVAMRFELYLRGLEIANAASELTDPRDQLARFRADNQTRLDLGLPPMPIDHNLIAAMQGLPPCSGIAVGLDRLLMVLGGFERIGEVLLFDAERA